MQYFFIFLISLISFLLLIHGENPSKQLRSSWKDSLAHRLKEMKVEKSFLRSTASLPSIKEENEASPSPVETLKPSEDLNKNLPLEKNESFQEEDKDKIEPSSLVILSRLMNLLIFDSNEEKPRPIDEHKLTRTNDYKKVYPAFERMFQEVSDVLIEALKLRSSDISEKAEYNEFMKSLSKGDTETAMVYSPYVIPQEEIMERCMQLAEEWRKDYSLAKVIDNPANPAIRKALEDAARKVYSDFVQKLFGEEIYLALHSEANEETREVKKIT